MAAGPLLSMLATAVVLLAVYVAVDPLQRSPIAGLPNFRVREVPRPAAGVLEAIPRDEGDRLKAAEVKFGGQIFGPESVVFDARGRGPYTGAGDGRIMRWDGDAWTEFAVMIPNRTADCAQPKPLAANIRHEHKCGRPLGLRFHKTTGDLFIMDAYLGLHRVGPEGGVAELVTRGTSDQPVTFGNDLDIDDDGTIYFTDSSAKYPRRMFLFPVLEGEDSGRLLKWDPATKETTVAAAGLRFPNGIAFSKDHSFLVICDTVIGQLQRYWVKGPKAGQVEHFAWLAGYPDNVRTNEAGEFWVALHCRRNAMDMFFKSYPRVKQAMLRLPVSTTMLYGLFSGRPHGAVYKYGEDGQVLDVLEDRNGDVVRLVSEVEEHDGKLYMGSVLLPHVYVYTL